MLTFNPEKIVNQKSNHIFYFSVILLLGVGLATLYSSSYDSIKKQVIYGIIGVASFFICSQIPISLLRKCIVYFLGGTAVLCILPHIPKIGFTHNGANRWIAIGSITYQPSEAVKFFLPIYLAHRFEKKADNIDDFKTGILMPVLVTGIFFFLIIKQNDFSTAIFIVFNVLVIFFLAGMHYRYFIAAAIIILPVSTLLVFMKEHRVKRFISFLKPGWDLKGTGFQVNNSREAIISGGLWGKGIGEGTYDITSIPEIHSDFIFSTYAEETGFIGIILFFALFVVFAIFGYSAAIKSENNFGRLLAASLTTMVVSQALLNVAVVSGALPSTGIPLPFFSAGGSSLLTTLSCAGLIANIAGKGGKKYVMEDRNVIGNVI